MRIGTAYFGNRILRHAAADMKLLARQGFNTIIHTFSENDLRFMKQAVKEIVAASHDAGHEVYIDPWGVGQGFGGEAFSLWAQMHPLDGCQMLNDGKPAAAACPNHAGFRAFIKEWIEAAAWTGADVAFWDEPHFYLSNWMIGRPNTWGCLCGDCRRLFAEKYNKPMPTEETEEVKAFKSACLLDFLKFCVREAHRAGLRNALCVLPYDSPDTAKKKWLPFARIPHLDVFGTDPYWIFAKAPVESVGDYAAAVREVCDKVGGRDPQIWIQGFRIPAGREAETGRAVELAAAAGVNNIAVWGVDACKHLSWIRPDDPDKVWRTIVRAMRKVSGEKPA